MKKKRSTSPAATDVMLDIETLGTGAEAIIVAIGACKFTLDSDHLDDDVFKVRVSVESNLRAGRKLTEPTLFFWFEAEPEARKETFYGTQETLEGALVTLTDWYGDPKTTWANGTDFDIAILAHAFSQFDMTPPWNYQDVRDYRTLKRMPFAERAEKPARGELHTALHDAVYQARHLQAIYKQLPA